jgi:hypothetical protein
VTSTTSVLLNSVFFSACGLLGVGLAGFLFLLLLDAGAAGSVLWSKGAGGLSLPGLLNGTPRVDTRHHKGGP